MNCRDYWKRYEDEGLTSEFEAHLRVCPGCRKEMDAEQALMGIVQHLPMFPAPDYLWDRIARELPEKHKKPSSIWVSVGILVHRIRAFLSPGRIFRLRPVVIGLAIMITSVLATRYYYLHQFVTDSKKVLEVDSVRYLDEIEREYLSAIETLTRQADQNKDAFDPELYDMYREKLTVLDEYIQQCKEALEKNEYNPNARKYLALAYKEKRDTLREMASHL